MKSFLPVTAVILGVVLLAASAIWAIVFPATRSWTEEKSARMAELGSQANLLKFDLIEAKANPRMHGGKNAAELQEEYDKLNAEYAALYDEFQGIRDSPKTAATFLKWSGIAFVVAGGLIVFATRSG